MTAHSDVASPLRDTFRASMRPVAASVSVVASGDAAGAWHGMAVTSAVSLSMEPPSMMVAVNRSASVHPVIQGAGWFSLNLMAECHADLLEAFSRSDLRDRRFLPEHWSAGLQGLPVLKDALSTHLCRVTAAHDFGTHTVFFGQVEDVILPEPAARTLAPLVWFNGARAALSATAET
ncbi:flavin reductase family protein [Paracoccus denitrificans]|jgi:flavin reductase (DIM6/NTAB) family NADH-FMN oxidoreductase RutF|uniref:Flavin reductase domain protein, FMN-binding protein n=1 Tax=Paracoccus denitrificans (strain Pd 1222) TaxID=318586 RepID=A1AYH2_PARDP|nr:flavin reductase family protein [Paracoccus denitrificans]ABL68316.1 flavin reductase domain protein, FMN-binding protein [Paracoccus denitrificans PD1222]MBB4627832.1 flavin reductase (DIM6/NTAB) family NADH-FMN oxidoreductase RutF [Paracoccus denitrificans]MCU7428633.1 flavin reductase family protein [Paracoccus denitrificans]UPV95335.1 flavin reductase family protein [Paracoccus denitrificans]WQO32606.1 flavin reductase family protein [Paracoccus denitrificans]